MMAEAGTKTRTDTRDEIVFLDTETGGFRRTHPIVQIAAIAVDVALEGWPEVERFEVKLQFDPKFCDAEALELNSYDPEIWAREAIPTEMARQRLDAFFRRHQTLQLIGRPKGDQPGRSYSSAKVGGHNVVKFDLPKLVPLWGTQFKPFAFWQALDTLQLAAWVFGTSAIPLERFPSRHLPDNHKLPTLCAYFGIEHENAHDALGDVAATVELAKKLTAMSLEAGR